MSQKYRLDGGEVPSEGVFRAVAEVEGCSPLDLPALGGTVDPDALDVLCRGEADDVEVEFSYYGYTVNVSSREITLDPIEE